MNAELIKAIHVFDHGGEYSLTVSSNSPKLG